MKWKKTCCMFGHKIASWCIFPSENKWSQDSPPGEIRKRRTIRGIICPSVACPGEGGGVYPIQSWPGGTPSCPGWEYPHPVLTGRYSIQSELGGGEGYPMLGYPWQRNWGQSLGTPWEGTTDQWKYYRMKYLPGRIWVSGSIMGWRWIPHQKGHGTSGSIMGMEIRYPSPC